MLYQRYAMKVLEEALKVRRVVNVAGARQSGKTTLVRQFGGDIYRSLDDSNILELAKLDPSAILKSESGTVIVDEIQKAPNLITEIKKIVDLDPRKGQFLITGSANLSLLPEVQESLAGRIKNIRLHTIREGEVRGRKPNFLDLAFARKLPLSIKGEDKRAVLEIAFRGGYPEVLSFDKKARSDWHRDYLKSILRRDIKDVLNVRRIDVLEQLLEIIASWSSKFIDISSICSSLEISRSTVDSYINIFEALFIFDRVQPWIKSDYDRVGRRSKWYMADTGLLASILRWNIEEVMLDPDRSGKLIETLVHNEISTLVDLDSSYNLYHYRDRLNREIDFIVENENGAILGIEVKAGNLIGPSDFKHLKWFKDNMAKEREFIGMILYTGESALCLNDNMYVMPISAFWS